MADKDTYDELITLTDSELVERRRQIAKDWARWDRKSDPTGEYTARQEALSAVDAVIEQVQKERNLA